jgi:hypothetical protein
LAQVRWLPFARNSTLAIPSASDAVATRVIVTGTLKTPVGDGAVILTLGFAQITPLDSNARQNNRYLIFPTHA